MYACICKSITVAEVRSATQSARTPDALVALLGLQDDECCGRCASETDRLFSLSQGE